MKKAKPTPQIPDGTEILVGTNIAQARHNKGWTQRELADKIGIDSVTMSRLETGTSMLSISRLVEIADALDVGLVDLIGGISYLASDQAREIFGYLKPLSRTDRQLLLNMVKQFSGRLAKK
jgi:transcriptional regulator with XRE-family HTH domain